MIPVNDSFITIYVMVIENLSFTTNFTDIIHLKNTHDVVPCHQFKHPLDVKYFYLFDSLKLFC